MQQYKEAGSGDEYKNDPTSALGSSKQIASLRPPLATQRLGGGNSGAGRSPIITKSMEHVYGVQNLQSDAIGSVV